MKSLIVIGKNVLEKIFSETAEWGFKSRTKFFDHTLDIHRRIENIYVNVTREYRNKTHEPKTIALKFEMWGMELGRVVIPLVVTAKDKASDQDALQKDLINIICECPRIKQTHFAPTHLIAIITVVENKFESVYREIYYLEKWQSEEITNND